MFCHAFCLSTLLSRIFVNIHFVYLHGIHSCERRHCCSSRPSRFRRFFRPFRKLLLCMYLGNVILGTIGIQSEQLYRFVATITHTTHVVEQENYVQLVLTIRMTGNIVETSRGRDTLFVLFFSFSFLRNNKNEKLHRDETNEKKKGRGGSRGKIPKRRICSAYAHILHTTLFNNRFLAKILIIIHTTLNNLNSCRGRAPIIRERERQKN